MKKQLGKISKFKILTILAALISNFVLCINGVLKNYDIVTLIIFIIMYNFFSKYLKINKEYKKGIIIFSIIFSFLLVFGNLCITYMKVADVSIFSKLLSIKSLISYIGYYFIWQALLNYLLPQISKFEVINKYKNNLSHKKCIKIFAISFILLIICYLPYLFTMYPGLLSVDSMGELNKASHGILNIDNHTIVHLLVIRLAYLIGSIFSKDLMISVLVYSLIQIMTMACIFAYLITFLYKKNVKKFVLFLIFLFYALVPIFGYYSVVMWKDIFFGTFCLLLSIECYEMVEDKDLKISTLIKFSIASLLVIFFRNNAIYMYFILIICSFFFFKGNYKKITYTFIVILSIFFVVKGPIFSYFKVSTSGSAEYLAIPLQQIGRMAYKDVKFTTDEKEQINKLLNVYTIHDVYNPGCVDPIKFNEDFNVKNFQKNKISYLNLWIKLIIKHPKVATEAYAISTLGYWYPNVYDRAYEVVSVNNSLGITTERKTPSWLCDFIINILGNYDGPIVCFFWSIGLFIWISFILIYMTNKKNNWKSLYVFVPVIGVLITLFIATPVYNETRYIFSIFTTMPLFCMLPYLKIKKQINFK